MIRYRKIILTLLSASFLLAGCESFLDEKQNQKLVIPSGLSDLMAILDVPNVMNMHDPGALTESADEHYMEDGDLASLNEFSRRVYTWEKGHLFRPGNSNDWTSCYGQVYRANVVLDHIDRIQRYPGDGADWDNLKGMAHFARGKAFTLLAWGWAPAYDPGTADRDPGIPLRLNPNFNELSRRGTTAEAYRQIIVDLEMAARSLPDRAVHVMRPSKAAAHAWLARVYLSMREYGKALAHADSCLHIQGTLMDYNGIAPDANPAFPSFNPEVIHHCETRQMIYPPMAKVDSSLYAMFGDGDLRKGLFFFPVSGNRFGFKGSYAGSGWVSSLFSGVATDEVYLMRAECHARGGNPSAARGDLNHLLKHRIASDAFVPLVDSPTGEELLDLILSERRKELFWRGVRWMDIKRLNKEGRGIILTRTIGGAAVILSPNDPRYALVIPEDVIELSGMPQNIR